MQMFISIIILSLLFIDDLKMDLIDLEQAVQELSGKIVVKRRDNEAQQRAQQAAIDKNEGKKFYQKLFLIISF